MSLPEETVGVEGGVRMQPHPPRGGRRRPGPWWSGLEVMRSRWILRGGACRMQEYRGDVG